MPIYAYSKRAPVPAALAGGDYLVSLSVQRVDGEALTPAELRKIRAALTVSSALDAEAPLAKTLARRAAPAKTGRTAG